MCSLSLANLLCSTELHVFLEKNEEKSPSPKKFSSQQLVKLMTGRTINSLEQKKIYKNPNSLIRPHSLSSLLCCTQLYLFQDKKEEQKQKKKMKAFLLATSKINDWPYNKNLEQNNSSKIQIVSFVHFLWLLYCVAPRRISSMRKWMKKVQN